MVFPVFDCEIDAYWWVLCTEKYFKRWNIPETQKMGVAAIAMKGPALTWWLRWYPRHLWMNWDEFTSVFLWKFKPEWRVILPVPDDEEEAGHGSSLLMSPSVSVAADSTITVNDLSKCALESSTIADTTIFVDQVQAQLVVDEESIEQIPIVESFPEDEEQLEFQSQPLAQGVSIDEQSTVAEEEIRDFNQFSSSPVVTDVNFAYWKEEFMLVTFASAPAVPLSMKTTVNTTSTTPQQHMVPLFDPGGNFGIQESRTTKEFTPPPKPPYRKCHKIPVEFQVIQNFSMPPPLPEPPDTGNITVKFITTMSVSGVHFMFVEIPLSEIGMLEYPTTLMTILPRYQNNLTSEARIDFPKFLLVLVPCYTAISVFRDDMVFGYGTRKSIECLNIMTLFTDCYVFDEMVLPGTCYFSVKNELFHFKMGPYMNYFLQFGDNCVHTVVGSYFTVPFDALLKKYVIIWLVSLKVIIIIGYEFNFVIGRIFFVLAAAIHGSVIDASKLFESLADVVIWSSLIKSCARVCSANLASYLFVVMDLLGLKIGNCTLFVFCSPNIHCDNHRVCLDLKFMHTASFSHAKGSLQIPIPLVEKLQAPLNTHVLLHNSILSSIISTYLGLDYIVANPPPPPEPPDVVVIRTSILVQHLHEQACLSLFLLLMVIGNITAAPPPPKTPDLCHKVVNLNAICRNWRFGVCNVVGIFRFYLSPIVSVALISFSKGERTIGSNIHFVIVLHFVLDVVTLLSGCFVHKGSSQFNQWLPGGYSFVHWEGLLEILKSFAIVGVEHAVMGVGPSNPLESFYEILDRLPILFNFVSAPYCLALNSMAKKIINFLSNAATSDFVPGHLVYNDIVALIMKVKLKEQCKFIDIFSKLYVRLSLIVYFAFGVAWCKNKQNRKGLVAIVPSRYLIFYYYTRVKLIDKAYEIGNGMGRLVTRSYSWDIDTFLNLVTGSTIIMKQWSSCGRFDMSIGTGSFSFKQWDPGKILFQLENVLFYNLEDKVDLNGGSNVMIQSGI